MTWTPGAKGLWTGLRDSDSCQKEHSNEAIVNLLLDFVSVQPVLLSANSMRSLTARRGLGFFSVAMALCSSSSIASFLFRLASVAWNIAVRSTSLLD